MTRNIDKVLHEINHFEPVDDNWLRLDELLAELWQTQRPESGIDAMLNVLERFPQEDGGGVLWSIVHGLESMPEYETNLIVSLQRQPSHLGLIMISRIINTGVNEVGGKAITDILEQVMRHEKLPAALREEVVKIKERINNKL